MEYLDDGWVHPIPGRYNPEPPAMPVAGEHVLPTFFRTRRIFAKKEKILHKKQTASKQLLNIFSLYYFQHTGRNSLPVLTAPCEGPNLRKVPYFLHDIINP